MSDGILALSQSSRQGDETKISLGESWSRRGDDLIEILQYVLSANSNLVWKFLSCSFKLIDKWSSWCKQIMHFKLYTDLVTDTVNHCDVKIIDLYFKIVHLRGYSHFGINTAVKPGWWNNERRLCWFLGGLHEIIWEVIHLCCALVVGMRAAVGSSSLICLQVLFTHQFGKYCKSAYCSYQIQVSIIRPINVQVTKHPRASPTALCFPLLLFGIWAPTSWDEYYK